MADVDYEAEPGLRTVFLGINPVVDIIAVPGLGAHPKYTWVKKNPTREGSGEAEQVMWLKDLLPHAIPNARILKYNYNSNYLIDSCKQDLRSIAERLINAIHEQRMRERREINTTDRPIIFIGHSFGGIVVQEALLVAHRDGTTTLQYISQNTCGVLFLGTPHRGSSIASLGKTITFFASVLNLRPDGQLLDTLRLKSERLHLLLNDFTIVAKTLGIKLVCFYELRETAMMRRYGLGKLFKCMVVDKFSATIEGYKSIALDLDHSGLNKFGSEEDEAFRLVSSELKDLVGGTQSLIHERSILVSRKKYFLMPYRENENFTPRGEPYGRLSELIQNRNSEKQLRIAIIGLGGIGKTQIAMRLAYQHKPTSNVFWIHGSTRDNFIQNYREIARNIGIFVNTGAEEDIVRSLKSWLDSDESGHWLMIIDNADNLGPDMLKLFMFALPICRGTLVFTTRDSNIVGPGSLVPEGYEIRLGVMNNPESKMTFLRLSGIDGGNQNQDSYLNLHLNLLPELNPDPGNNYNPESNPNRGVNPVLDQEVSVLIDLLGNLPLAISQAASYIKKAKTPIAQYIELLRESEEKQAKLLGNPIIVQEQYDGVPKSIMQTWEITLNQLDEASQKLLQIMSLLDTQNITTTLVNSEIVRLMLHCQDEIDFDRVIEPLLSFSIISISRETDNDGYSYNMHRLVGLWIRRRIGSLLEPIRLTLRLMLAVFPNKPRTYITECSKLLPHALCILSHSEPYKHMHNEVKIGWTRLEVNIAVYYIEVFRLDQAEILLKNSLEFYTSRHLDKQGKCEEYEEGALQSMYYLGAVFYKRARYKDSMEQFEQTLQGKEKICGRDHPSTLAVVENMAVVLKAQGENTKALEWYERALKGYEKALSPDHPSTLNTINNMANVFQAQGQFTKALEWYERALKGYEKALSPDHPSTLNTINNMAIVFKAQGQFTKALEWYERALKGYEKAFGPDHPSTLDTINNMAIVFKIQGQFTKAFELYERALKGYEKALGPDHPNTLGTIHNIALLLDSMGQQLEALPRHQRVFTGREKSLGKDHYQTLISLYLVVDLQLRIDPTQCSQDLLCKLCSSNCNLLTCNTCSLHLSESSVWYKCRNCRSINYCERCFSSRPEEVDKHSAHDQVCIRNGNDAVVLSKDEPRLPE